MGSNGGTESANTATMGILGHRPFSNFKIKEVFCFSDGLEFIQTSRHLVAFQADLRADVHSSSVWKSEHKKFSFLLLYLCEPVEYLGSVHSGLYI